LTRADPRAQRAAGRPRREGLREAFTPKIKKRVADRAVIDPLRSASGSPTEEGRMQLQVKGRNFEVSDSVRRYIDQKLARIGRQLHEFTQVEVELAVEKNPSIAANQVAEATIFTKGPGVVRARAAASDMRTAIDELSDKLLRQVKEYRERRSPRPRTPPERGQ
jgi:putative sigma-54 modulation protein